MSRITQMFAIVLPSMIAGGVVFGSAFGRADDGRAVGGLWARADSGTIVAQATPARPAKPPVPPTPPAPAPKQGSGVSVSIHDGKIQIDGVKDLVDGQFKSALDALANVKDLPPDVRTKLEKRLAKVRASIDKRLGNLKATDLDRLGDELGKMGDEIGAEMDEFGKDMDKWGKGMDQWGKGFGKNFAKQLGNVHFGHHHDADDDDDDDQITSVPDIDDQDDLDEAVADLGDLSLKPPQRDAITKLRTDSDKQVAVAKKALDQASDTLKKQLDNPASSDADVAKAIDAVTQQEAAIRKARILAWHGARRVLDESQRKKLEGATKKTK